MSGVHEQGVGWVGGEAAEHDEEFAGERLWKQVKSDNEGDGNKEFGDCRVGARMMCENTTRDGICMFDWSSNLEASLYSERGATGTDWPGTLCEYGS